MKVLQCHSEGDKRFSALCAKVNVFGKTDTIENHYQLSKRIGDIVPTNWRDIKGKTPTHIVINNKEYPARFLSSWYRLLWILYLDSNPELVEYAKQFSGFEDKFKGKSTNCQADIVRLYVTFGRDHILNQCEELLSLLILNN
ncbi:hypothetical protein HSE3_gp015 [Bacillus phage vB_BceM-HSE3]|nr:hypothetical protein HSE3_gp015 [Bacillus phage vB_BceM-HSE3]